MPSRSKEGNFDRPFVAGAKWLIARGVKPNHITFLQIPVFYFMWQAGLDLDRYLFFGLAWLLVVLDGLDGIVARVGGMASRSGALLDAVFDTMSIALVLWGAIRFHPDQTALWIVLFGLNVLLYLQNMVLEEKVVSYVRGPVLMAIALPDLLWLSIAGGLTIVTWLLMTRVPAVGRRLRGISAPPTP